MDRSSWHCIGDGDQNPPWEKERQNDCLRRHNKIAEKKEVKSKGEKERYHLNAEFQRIARRDKKAFLKDQCKEIEDLASLEPKNAQVKSLSRVWLCDPMDCSPPGSSIRGILQARILESVAIFFPRGSSQPRDRTQVSCISCTGRRFFTISVTWETHFTRIYKIVR